GRHKDVGLVQLDGASEQLLRPVPEGPFAAILDWYADQDVKARVAAFKPPEVPAVVLYPPGAEPAVGAPGRRAAGDLPPPLAGLVNEYVGSKFTPEALKGTLCLNASCPLVRRLAELPAGPAKEAALTLVYQIARLFAGRTLTAADAATAFRETTGAIEGLLK